MHYSVNLLDELNHLIANDNDTCFVQETQITYIMENGNWVKQRTNQTLTLLDELIKRRT